VPLPQVAVSRPWHVGFAIRGSGDGGLARRASAAATAVVVPAVVATTMIAIVIIVVVLVPVATVAAIAATGRARQHGGRRPECRGRNVGVERHRGSQRTCTIHVERRVAPDNGAHVLKALVQPPKNVEDEDPIFDGGT
jgi:hypothetical protein